MADIVVTGMWIVGSVVIVLMTAYGVWLGFTKDRRPEEGPPAMSWEPNEDKARDMICEWLRANDVDPDTVPLRSAISWTWTTITLDVVVMDDNGMPRTRDNEVVTERRTVPLKRQAPKNLAAALRLIQYSELPR